HHAPVPEDGTVALLLRDDVCLRGPEVELLALQASEHARADVERRRAIEPGNRRMPDRSHGSQGAPVHRGADELRDEVAAITDGGSYSPGRLQITQGIGRLERVFPLESVDDQGGLDGIELRPRDVR